MRGAGKRRALGEGLEELYRRYNRRCHVGSDPVGFLYRYPDPRDREIIGLIASSLAYGRVAQIHRSITRALGELPSPAAFLSEAGRRLLLETFGDFRHRFTTGDEFASLLFGIGRVVERYGSLEECFARGLSGGTVVAALGEFVRELREAAGGGIGFLLPEPERGSACKRLNLYLRWMVRCDEVDPGGWEAVSPGNLLVPLDTHMFRICSRLGLTRRKRADMKAAVEITRAFAEIAPDDPVKYDFALTRLGINGGRGEEERFFRNLR